MCPPIIGSKKGEREAIVDAAKHILVSARTAPKSGGVDDVLTCIIFGREKDSIAEKMEEIGEERNVEGFRRDAKNVRDSQAVVLIGVRGNKSLGLDCGSCGVASCQEFSRQNKRVGRDFIGPTCIFKALDLGIALGSAVKTASILNVDNRIMYRIGSAAMKLKLIPDATIVMGVPVSAHGKSVYFDRAK